MWTLKSTVGFMLGISSLQVMARTIPLLQFCLPCTLAPLPTVAVMWGTLDATFFFNGCLILLSHFEMKWPMCWHHPLTMTIIPHSSCVSSRRQRGLSKPSSASGTLMSAQILEYLRYGQLKPGIFLCAASDAALF